MRPTFPALLILVLASAKAQGQLGATVSNWTPPSGSGFSPSGGLHLMTDVTSPILFVGVSPCRVVDTRGPTGAFGGPALAAASPRSFFIPAGPCAGLPSLVKAYSLNVTATKTLGPGFLKLYPQGGTPPVVSTLNYLADQTVANAAIVPAGAAGGITVVAGVSGTDLIIDINGYYTDTFSPAASSTLTYNSGTTAMTVQNLDDACHFVCGLDVGVNGGNAIEGVTFATTGAFHGVGGFSISPSSNVTGVLGEDLSAIPPPVSIAATSGVRGESKFGFGVFGASTYQGIVGLLVDSAGNYRSEGDLGTTDGLNVWGVYCHGDSAATGTKTFVEPHPTDAAKVIRYVSLEGPESGTYFRGSGRIVDGHAVIDVPESFRMVTDTVGLTVQLTPIGELATMAAESKDLDRIVVLASRDVAFDYLVHGVRRAFRDFQPIAEGRDFVPRSADERMPAYLTDEARRRLIANGTYNEDGTVNRATADRLGWTKLWADREAAVRAAAQRTRDTTPGGLRPTH